MEQRIIMQQEYSNYRYIRERCEVKRHTYNFKHATYDEVMCFFFHNSEVTSVKKNVNFAHVIADRHDGGH